MNKTMKGYLFSKPMIVTYSYSLIGIFKMYATIIIRFNVEHVNQPIMASNKEIIKEITRITGHKVIRIIDHCSI